MDSPPPGTHWPPAHLKIGFGGGVGGVVGGGVGGAVGGVGVGGGVGGCVGGGVGTGVGGVVGGGVGRHSFEKHIVWGRAPLAKHSLSVAEGQGTAPAPHATTGTVPAPRIPQKHVF